MCFKRKFTCLACVLLSFIPVVIVFSETLETMLATSYKCTYIIVVNNYYETDPTLRIRTLHSYCCFILQAIVYIGVNKGITAEFKLAFCYDRTKYIFQV